MSTFRDIVIIGAGAFGASTALELARLGHRVTVLERTSNSSAADSAASSDINKIIRADYDKCIDLWRSHPLYSRYYHEVGVFFRSGAAVPQEPLWVTKGVQNAIAGITGFQNKSAIKNAMPKAVILKQADDVIKVFPEIVRGDLGEACVRFNGQSGYFNPIGGWAESGDATRSVLLEAQRHGAVVYPNAEVISLVYDGYVNCKPRVAGVRTADGRVFNADHVILAAGSWTPHVLRLFQLHLEREVMRPSAHCVLMIKIDPETSVKYEKTPVTFNMSNGFYSFPPNKDGILKCALHTLGDAHPQPQEHSGNGYPHSDEHPFLQTMHEEIKRLYPKICLEGPEKNAEVHATRICWYCDTRDENFLIDFHPLVDGLLVASGDSGHGFKFLPVLGRLIMSRLFHIDNDSEVSPDIGLSAHQRKVFSFDHHFNINDKLHVVTSSDSTRLSTGMSAPAIIVPFDSKL
ncbi:hypothetical protein MCUN1_000642 [Malassezia cuniculi]|uniref:FAD dependent oxidoreductase domain-containing protein n=1 Tax=Malassezia cuniculi TaxID=948313 RepID=A0AAF0J4V1_9BASI|nr:hypothetical protein MCUN1_000642 [Malassezia cuniculi]